jgi:hypothetical protein
VKIYLNGLRVRTKKTILTYEELVDMATLGAPRKAPYVLTWSVLSSGHSGSLKPGQELMLEEGMDISAVTRDGA